MTTKPKTVEVNSTFKQPISAKSKTSSSIANWIKTSIIAATLPMFFLAVENSHRLTADEVTKWNEIAFKASFDTWGDSVFESYAFAMAHVAIHDALNAIEPRYQSYAFCAQATSDASPEAAVATAAHNVLVDQFNRLASIGAPSQQAVLDTAYAASLAAIPDSAGKTAGIAIGELAAATILGLRASDNWESLDVFDFNYPQGTAPGEYRFTPPFDFVFAPEWGTLPTFILRHAAQFRPGPPYRVTSRKYTEDFNEVKSLGGNGTSTQSARTAEQTEIALFWLESAPMQWNRIAKTVSDATGLDLWENARLFALLNLALADGYIACFDTKYHYNFWRPITAIREAANDGNPKTISDPTWTPLSDTPAIPDYDSGHCVEGGAAAEVLKRFFGTDELGFTTRSTTFPPGGSWNDPGSPLRTYSGFSDAANENGLSRILIGFHFRDAVNTGIKHGRQIGKYGFNHFLRPIHNDNHDSNNPSERANLEQLSDE